MHIAHKIAKCPLCMILTGIIGLIVLSFVGSKFINQKPVSASDLVEIKGKVETASLVQHRKSRYLEIVLPDQPLPFRSYTYSYGLLPGSLDRLGPGSRVVIGITKQNKWVPHKNVSGKETHYSIVTLAIDGQEALPISVHNRNAEQDHLFGLIFTPIMGLMCLFMIVAGFRRM